VFIADEVPQSEGPDVSFTPAEVLYLKNLFNTVVHVSHDSNPKTDVPKRSKYGEFLGENMEFPDVRENPNGRSSLGADDETTFLVTEDWGAVGGNLTGKTDQDKCESSASHQSRTTQTNEVQV